MLRLLQAELGTFWTIVTCTSTSPCFPQRVTIITASEVQTNRYLQLSCAQNWSISSKIENFMRLCIKSMKNACIASTQWVNVWLMLVSQKLNHFRCNLSVILGLCRLLYINHINLRIVIYLSTYFTGNGPAILRGRYPQPKIALHPNHGFIPHIGKSSAGDSGPKPHFTIAVFSNFLTVFLKLLPLCMIPILTFKKHVSRPHPW